MAQIFASDRASHPAPKAAPRAMTQADDRLAALQAAADTSQPTERMAQLQAKEAAALQRVEDEEALQGKFDGPLQRVEDEEELMQGKFSAPLQRKAGGGLPDGLQSGVEQLSGTDLSGVQVHYNSARPAQMQAHAYAQGNQIHLAPGQERHLPHEAWHVAQQQQGRVQQTTQMAGVGINDDPALEREADVMGAQAANMVTQNRDQDA